MDYDNEITKDPTMFAEHKELSHHLRYRYHHHHVRVIFLLLTLGFLLHVIQYQFKSVHFDFEN